MHVNAKLIMYEHYVRTLVNPYFKPCTWESAVINCGPLPHL